MGLDFDKAMETLDNRDRLLEANAAKAVELQAELARKSQRVAELESKLQKSELLAERLADSLRYVQRREFLFKDVVDVVAEALAAFEGETKPEKVIESSP